VRGSPVEHGAGRGRGAGLAGRRGRRGAGGRGRSGVRVAGAAHAHGAEVVVVELAAEVHRVHGVDRAGVPGAVSVGAVGVDASGLGRQYGLLSGRRPVWLRVAASPANAAQVVRTEIGVVVDPAEVWVAAVRVATIFERVFEPNVSIVARPVHLHFIWRSDRKARYVHRQP